eukprot:sb/3469844/
MFNVTELIGVIGDHYAPWRGSALTCLPAIRGADAWEFSNCSLTNTLSDPDLVAPDLVTTRFSDRIIFSRYLTKIISPEHVTKSGSDCNVNNPQFLLRLYPWSTVPSDRLLGTQVHLIPGSGEFDSDTSSLVYCGTINSINPNRESRVAQTYTIHCSPLIERIKGVVLYDTVAEETQDKNQIVMNIAQVMVYNNGPRGPVGGATIVKKRQCAYLIIQLSN